MKHNLTEHEKQYHIEQAMADIVSLEDLIQDPQAHLPKRGCGAKTITVDGRMTYVIRHCQDEEELMDRHFEYGRKAGAFDEDMPRLLDMDAEEYVRQNPDLRLPGIKRWDEE